MSDSNHFRTPVTVVAIALALAGCGSGGQHSAASPVRCGLVSCSRGRAGQPCTIAGYPGVIVQVSPTALGCDPKEHINGLGSSQPPPQPSPVSTAATLSGTCTMGWWQTMPAGVNKPDVGFTSGSPAGVKTVTGWYGETDAPALAYQVALANNGSATADASGFVVIFYDSSGTEVGQDEQTFGDTFITPGQALNCTELSSTDLDGNETDSSGTDGNIPADAASCQFLQWYGGAS